MPRAPYFGTGFFWNYRYYALRLSSMSFRASSSKTNRLGADLNSRMLLTDETSLIGGGLLHVPRVRLLPQDPKRGTTKHRVTRVWDCSSPRSLPHKASATPSPVRALAASMQGGPTCWIAGGALGSAKNALTAECHRHSYE